MDAPTIRRRRSLFHGLDRKFVSTDGSRMKENTHPGKRQVMSRWKDSASVGTNQEFHSEERFIQPELSQLTMSQGTSGSFRSNASSSRRKKSNSPPMHQNSSVSSRSNDQSRHSSRSIVSGRLPFQNLPKRSSGHIPSDGSMLLTTKNEPRFERQNHPASSSVASSRQPQNRVLPHAGPAQRLLRMAGSRHTKSYSTTLNSRLATNTMLFPMATKPTIDAAESATTSSLARYSINDDFAGTSYESFEEAPQFPTSRNHFNESDGSQSASMSQDQMNRFRVELEAMCAERIKVNEDKLEEKLKAMIEEESQAAKTRTEKIETVQTELKKRITESESTLQFTKHDLEERLKTVSSEIRSKEVEIESGIQEIDDKLAKMRENVTSHTQTLEQATESHLERISKSTSASIKTIKELAEISTASIYKKCEDICSALFSTMQQASVIGKAIVSSPRERNTHYESSQPPSSQECSAPGSEGTTQSPRSNAVDAKQRGMDSSADESPSRRKRFRRRVATGENILEAKHREEDNSGPKGEKANLKRRANCHTSPRFVGSKTESQTTGESGSGQETSPSPRPQPKRQCVTPSGERSQQLATPNNKTPYNTRRFRRTVENARSNSETAKTSSRTELPLPAPACVQQLVTPTNKIPLTKSSKVLDEKVHVHCGKRKGRTRNRGASPIREEADIVPFEIITENCECPSPLGNMSANIMEEEVEMVREVVPPRLKAKRRKRRKQAHVYGTRSSATRGRILYDDSCAFGRFG